MGSKIKFTDVSSFDMKLETNIAEKVKKQKQKILTFLKSVETDEKLSCLSDPIITATIHGNSIMFTLFQECTDKPELNK